MAKNGDSCFLNRVGEMSTFCGQTADLICECGGTFRLLKWSVKEALAALNSEIFVKWKLAAKGKIIVR